MYIYINISRLITPDGFERRGARLPKELPGLLPGGQPSSSFVLLFWMQLLLLYLFSNAARESSARAFHSLRHLAAMRHSPGESAESSLALTFFDVVAPPFGWLSSPPPSFVRRPIEHCR